MAVDWEAVLAIALRNAEKAGICDRYRTIAGSAFEVDWGSVYDLVLFPGSATIFTKLLSPSIRSDESGDACLMRIHSF